jgi:hypothetical protein
MAVVIAIAVLGAIVLGFCALCVIVVRTKTGRQWDGRPKNRAAWQWWDRGSVPIPRPKVQPGSVPLPEQQWHHLPPARAEEPTLWGLADVVTALDAELGDRHDVAKVSSVSDAETMKRVWGRIKAVAEAVFPAEDGVQLSAYGSTIELRKNQNVLCIDVEMTPVTRTGTLDLSKAEYVWNAPTSRRDESSLAPLKILLVCALAALIIAAAFNAEWNWLFYILFGFVVLLLLFVASSVLVRGDQAFPPQKVRILEQSIRNILASELRDKG